MYMFIQGSDPLPSPFNLVPSVYRITAWKNSRNNTNSKMFSEADLLKVNKMRNLIKSFKLNYLREAKLARLSTDLGTAQFGKMGSKISAQVAHVNSSVSSVHKRTRELLESKDVGELIGSMVFGSDDDKEENKNIFTKKFKEFKNRRSNQFAQLDNGEESAGGSTSMLASFFRSFQF